jgi:hypothetical protein
MRKFLPACFLSRKNCNKNFSINPLFPPLIELGIFLVLGARDDHYTTETCLPKDVRRWPILSQVWKFDVGENYLIDHAKSLCRSI